ncbi:MAG: alpha/beta hydrolase [Bacteriovoracaceae bacterium]|nr:alpha/beta hydrolase [Bacteriovoracaceae bacterium]
MKKLLILKMMMFSLFALYSNLLFCKTIKITKAQNAPVKICNPQQIASCFRDKLTANHPFEIYHGKKTEYVALLIHGLSDSPYFYKDVAPIIFNKGINVYSIRLKGHGTKVEHLKQVSYLDWIEDVKFGMKEALKRGKKVIIAGFSTGGGLASYFATTKKNNAHIRGLILFSPAISLNMDAQVLCELSNENREQLGYEYVSPIEHSHGVKYQKIAGHAVCELDKLNQQFGTFLNRGGQRGPVYKIGNYRIFQIDHFESKFFDILFNHNFKELKVPSLTVISEYDDAVDINGAFLMLEAAVGPGTIVHFSDGTTRESDRDNLQILKYTVDELPHAEILTKKQKDSFTPIGNPHFAKVEAALTDYLNKYFVQSN